MFFSGQRDSDNSIVASDNLFSICLIIAEWRALKFQDYIIRGIEKNHVLWWEIKFNEFQVTAL